MTPEPASQDQRFASVVTRTHPYDIGYPEESTRAALRRFANRLGCYYVNPQFVVSADRPTPAFFKAARRAQGQWCRTLGKSLGSSNRRRNAKSVGPEERMLAHIGVLRFDGVDVWPKDWETLESLFYSSPPGPEGTPK